MSTQNGKVSRKSSLYHNIPSILNRRCDFIRRIKFSMRLVPNIHINIQYSEYLLSTTSDERNQMTVNNSVSIYIYFTYNSQYDHLYDIIYLK